MAITLPKNNNLALNDEISDKWARVRNNPFCNKEFTLTSHIQRTRRFTYDEKLKKKQCDDIYLLQKYSFLSK